MFRGSKNKKQQNMVDTIIGSETVIEGKIKHPTSLRIDGKVYGKIDCDGDVFVGNSGYIETKIKAKNIIIAGNVKGDLQTSEKVHIQEGGRLTGNATTKGIIIDDGGTFNGESVIVQEEDTVTKIDRKKSVTSKKKVDE